jgi:hypothetical protein
MPAEGLMPVATVLSGDTLTLTAPRSTAESEFCQWFCIRYLYQVCLKILLELTARGSLPVKSFLIVATIAAIVLEDFTKLDISSHWQPEPQAASASASVSVTACVTVCQCPGSGDDSNRSTGTSSPIESTDAGSSSTEDSLSVADSEPLTG